MSYILEALKKSQAERQLGAAPTIHALPIHPVAATAPGAQRRQLWIGFGAGALALAAALAAWRIQAPPAPPATLAAAAPAVAPLPAAAKATPAPNPPPARAPAIAKAGPAPLPMEAPPQAPLPKQPVPKPAPKPVAAPVQENLPSLRELPEAIQREVPPLAFGGYMYSKNPADRLLLIDKTLRREGEEVAPGLTLEKLLPAGAVLNFRGYRYRVGFK